MKENSKEIVNPIKGQKGKPEEAKTKRLIGDLVDDGKGGYNFEVSAENISTKDMFMIVTGLAQFLADTSGNHVGIVLNDIASHLAKNLVAKEAANNE